MSTHERHTLTTRNRFLIRKIWKFISDIGLGYADKVTEMRSNVISYRLNFLLLGTMIFLLLIIFIIQIIIYSELRIIVGILKIAALLIVSFLNLILANFGYQKISKNSLIFLPPLF